MPKPVSGNYLAGTSGDDTLDRRGYADDWTIDGRAGNDTIYGGSSHDSLLGGRGDDLIHGSIEDLVINGGGGVDTVSFSESAAGVEARLQGGLIGPTTGVLQASVLAGVENLTGSSHNDILAGNRSRNELNGGAGNDLLLASGTGDFLTGGDGGDTFEITSVTRTVTLTDFHYNEGDLIRIEGGATFSWIEGSGVDAEGNVQDAWIGTCDLLSGGTRTVIVLGADTTPSDDWII